MHLTVIKVSMQTGRIKLYILHKILLYKLNNVDIYLSTWLWLENKHHIEVPCLTLVNVPMSDSLVGSRILAKSEDLICLCC